MVTRGQLPAIQVARKRWVRRPGPDQQGNPDFKVLAGNGISFWSGPGEIRFSGPIPIARQHLEIRIPFLVWPQRKGIPPDQKGNPDFEVLAGNGALSPRPDQRGNPDFENGNPDFEVLGPVQSGFPFSGARPERTSGFHFWPGPGERESAFLEIRIPFLVWPHWRAMGPKKPPLPASASKSGFPFCFSGPIARQHLEIRIPFLDSPLRALPHENPLALWVEAVLPIRLCVFVTAWIRRCVLPGNPPTNESGAPRFLVFCCFQRIQRFWGEPPTKSSVVFGAPGIIERFDAHSLARGMPIRPDTTCLGPMIKFPFLGCSRQSLILTVGSERKPLCSCLFPIILEQKHIFPRIPA